MRLMMILVLAVFAGAAHAEPDYESMDKATLIAIVEQTQRAAGEMRERVARLVADVAEVREELERQRIALDAARRERDEALAKLADLVEKISRDPGLQERVAESDRIAAAIAQGELTAGMTMSQAIEAFGGRRPLLTQESGRGAYYEFVKVGPRKHRPSGRARSAGNNRLAVSAPTPPPLAITETWTAWVVDGRVESFNRDRNERRYDPDLYGGGVDP